MVPLRRLLDGARRLVRRSAEEAAPWGLLTLYTGVIPGRFGGLYRMSGLNLSKQGVKSVKGSCHNFCTASSKDITYKELKNLLNSKKVILIDVRGAQEILEHGKIPGSVNIPLAEVDEALQMDPEDFKDKYKEAKPLKSDRVVFSCLAGLRSKKALGTAISLGFDSAQHYPGGWKEWKEYEFPDRKQGK